MKTILKSKTRKFILRPIRLEDAKERFLCEQDKEARKNFMSTPKTVEDVKKEIKKTLKEMKKKKPIEEILAIDVNGNFIGFVGIHSLDGKSLSQKGTIGIISVGLHKKFRGKGLATKAVKLFISYCFKKYKLKRISGRCRSFNKASAKLMEKCGFTFEGKHKKEVYKDGKFYDNLYYAIVK